MSRQLLSGLALLVLLAATSLAQTTPSSQPVKPTSKTLKPENVCWDFSAPINSDSSDELPLVFITGFKIEYKAGGAATLLAKTAAGGAPFAVTFKSGSCRFFRTEADGTIPSLIKDTYTNPKNQTYTQLTPEGTIAP